MFEGIITALATPFKEDGSFDPESFKRLLQLQVNGGVKNFVVNGTTGESPCLSWQEVRSMCELVRSEVPQSRIILGAGSNCTQKTIHNAKQALGMHVDGLLLVTPYYNKPTQAGLVEHFLAVARSTPLPIVLYNVPGRTLCHIEAETLITLAHEPNIVGVKEASGTTELLRHARLKCPNTFKFLSGDDPSCVEFCLAGGCGAISVLSNILPSKLKDFYEAAIMRDLVRTNAYTQYGNINALLFCETNPIPVKMALHKMRVFSTPNMRLPLVRMSEPATTKLVQELKTLGLVP